MVPALIRRFHEAKLANAPEVVIWGTGTPLREFLHVDDMAAASLFVLDLPKKTYQAHTQPMLSHINVGSGQEVSIGQLANLVSEVVGYQGQLKFDPTKPDGTPRKLMDSSRLEGMGWKPNVNTIEGLKRTYMDFFQTHN